MCIRDSLEILKKVQEDTGCKILLAQKAFSGFALYLSLIHIWTLNMGGTAIGTGINADEGYLRRIVPNLTEISGMDFIQAFDLIDSTQNLDPFVAVSGAVKACAVTLSKMSNDLRLMSSGPRTGFGEINLPAKQNGSSIMPGKVNPVIPEVVNQVAFNILVMMLRLLWLQRLVSWN